MAEAGFDVVADLGAQRAAGDGEGDLDADDPVVVDVDVADHSEVDDAGVQLGVGDRLEHPPDFFGCGALGVHKSTLGVPPH